MKENMKLYRYIPLSGLIDIILSEALILVAPLEVWEDKYEGLVYKALKTNEGMNKIREITSKYSADKDEAAQVLLENTEYVRCQSWSRNRDSVVMWNAYPYDGQSIMIATNGEKLHKLGLRVEAINYIPNNFSLEDEINKVIDEKGITIHKVFLSKREAFRYENEVRVFQMPTGNKELDKYVKIAIQEVSEFLEEVMVHPSADDWYVDLVKKLCEKHNLNFVGKSKWYNFD